MQKKKIAVVGLLLAVCVTLFTACLTTFEKEMVGDYKLSYLRIANSDEIDVESAFVFATMKMTKKKDFVMSVSFNREYMESQYTYDMFENRLKNYFAGKLPARYESWNEYTNYVISEFSKDYTIKGTFTNSTGNPIFTPDDKNIKLADYGLGTFRFGNNALTIHGNKNIVVDFTFTKI